MVCGGFNGIGSGVGGVGMHSISIGFGFMPIMFLFRFFILIAIVIFVVKLFKRHNFGSSNALKLLDERLAKGEVTEEEYFKRKAIITQKN